MPTDPLPLRAGIAALVVVVVLVALIVLVPVLGRPEVDCGAERMERLEATDAGETAAPLPQECP